MIKPYLLIETSHQKINLNRCNVEHLGSHPYISWKIAKLIIRYREQHGPFKQLEELKYIKILDEQAYKKIKEYLYITTD